MCNVFLAHQNAPQKEMIIQHEINTCPWAKRGANPCDFQGRTLLLLYNYFIEVEHLQSTTSRGGQQVPEGPLCSLWCPRCAVD